MARAVLEAQIDSNIGDVNKGIEQAAENTDKLAKGAKKAEKGFGGIRGAIKKVGTALKAAGIGLIVAAFAKLFEMMGQNQKVMDGFNTAMTAINTAFQDFISLIMDNVEPITNNFKELFENPTKKIKEMSAAIKEGLIDRFNEWIEAMSIAGKALGHLVKGEFSEAWGKYKEAAVEMVDVYTGVDGTVEKVSESVSNYTKKVWDNAKAQVAANKEAKFAELEVRKLQAENLKLAEDERQIRDNVNLTFKERIEANERLSKILEEQQAAQKAALQTEIDALALAVQTNGNDEQKLALLAKEIEMLELEEAINGQMSEQLTNQVALENELRDAKVQTSLDGMSARERELAELEASYDEQVRLAQAAGESTTAIDKKFAKDKKKIKQDQVNEELSAVSGLSGALATLAGDNKELAAASAIIDTYVGANKALSASPPPFNFVAAAAVVAAGLANVSKIYSTDSGGGGGGTAPPASAGPAPQMMSGEFDLAGGIEPEPVKAYVVTDEMSNSQNQLANIRRRATI
tara:strand:- start:858 stop:2414 length:1557 start_codon:yes stop_codon:yes gene_type:complete